MSFPRSLILAALLFGIAGCSRSAPDASAANGMNLVAAEPSIVQDTSDPAAFVPLKSAAVKDAIHRALRSGQPQRWQDGTLGGYAVPSVTTGANGCRAVRYTVDQRPGAAYESITACDASR